MAQSVIIHTATRVIRRATTDPSPFVDTDETAVLMDPPIDLGGSPTGHWKLNPGNQKVAATAEEIIAAGLDEAQQLLIRQQKIADLLAAIDAALADVIVPTKLKTFLDKLKAFLT